MKKIISSIGCIFCFSIFIYAQSLGGGYQNTKWGMTLQEVRNILTANKSIRFDHEESSNGDRVLYYFEKESSNFRIKFSFNNGKLYYVEYKPFLNSGDRNTANMLLDELKKKYGNGKSYSTRFAGLNLPPGYDVTEWNDGETTIKFIVGWFEDWQGRFNNYKYTEIHYYSTAIQNEKDNAQKQREDEQRRRANNNLRDNL